MGGVWYAVSMPRFRRILLVLLLGALVNVLVAWACARKERRFPVRDISYGPVASEPSGAKQFLSDPTYMNRFGESRLTGLRRSSWYTLGVSHVDYTRWHDDGFAYSRTVGYLRFGLPLPSMQYVEQSTMAMNAFPEHATWRPEGWIGGWPLAPDRSVQTNPFGPIAIPGGPAPYIPPKHIYPLVPLPLGFALNTLFYAVLLYLPFATFITLRRRRRIRRNLCPSCGYSLAGAVPTNNSITCPECGKQSA